MPNPSQRSAPAGSKALRLPRPAGLALGTALTIALALPFAWWDPTQNKWPVLALAVALALDIAARIATQAARRRTGVRTEFHGLPSPILALGNAAWIGAAGVAAVSAFRPDLFPLLASALAGLVAMGACARLALARMVVAIDAAERAAAEAKLKGEGTRR